MKRPSNPAPRKDGSFDFVDPEFMSLYPALADACGNTFFDDKSPREVSTIRISFGPDSVGVLLNEPSTKKYAFTNGSSMVEALVALDAALADGSLAWRKSTYK